VLKSYVGVSGTAAPFATTSFAQVLTGGKNNKCKLAVCFLCYYEKNTFIYVLKTIVPKITYILSVHIENI
jgi:hypothetical protein